MIRFCSNILFLFYYIFINLFIKIINLINDDCILEKKKRGRFDMYSFLCINDNSQYRLLYSSGQLNPNICIRYLFEVRICG